MPRESINPAIHALLASASDGTGPGFVPMPTVEVGWHRDLGEVQIGLETPDTREGGPDSSGRHHIVDHLYAERARDIGMTARAALEAADGHAGTLSDVSLGRLVLDAVTAEGEAHTGWYTHLNRDGCNRLIRLVRKARDAAFGVDA